MPAEAMTKAFKRRSSARDVRSRKPALQTPFAPDAAASTATRPNVRDDGQRPSSRDGMAGVVRVIWVSREAEYFFGRDWTGQISLTLLQKIADWRSGEVPWPISRDKHKVPDVGTLIRLRFAGTSPSGVVSATRQTI
jgi:hypothetical protein